MTIRDAVEADVEAMMAIEADVFDQDAWSQAQMREDVLRETRWYAVATDDDRVSDASPNHGDLVGYVGIYLAPPDSDVQTLAVASTWRGRGIGRQLMRAAVDHAWERGCTRMFLEVRADNEAALALYESLGFTRMGRRRRYYRDGCDAVTMRLRRSEPPPLGSRS